MCGRYFLNPELSDELSKIISKIEAKGYPLKLGELAPSDFIPVLRQSADGRSVEALTMSWGFGSFQQGKFHINARSETVLEKPTFREAFLIQRLAIPTTGFYEWNAQKEKFIFEKEDEKELYLAGFYQVNRAGQMQAIILTTDANSSVSSVHERMPIILDKQAIRSWLKDTDFAIAQLKKKMPNLKEKQVSAKSGKIDLFEEMEL